MTTSAPESAAQRYECDDNQTKSVTEGGGGHLSHPLSDSAMKEIQFPLLPLFLFLATAQTSTLFQEEDVTMNAYAITTEP